MSIDREKMVRKKQTAMLAIVIVGVVIVVAVALSLSKATAVKVKTMKDSSLLPEDTVNAQDQWVVLGEKHINDIETRQKRLEDIINNMPTQGGHQIDNQAADNPKVPRNIENVPLPSLDEGVVPPASALKTHQSENLIIQKKPNEIKNTPEFNQSENGDGDSDGVDVVDINKPAHSDGIDYIPAGSFAKVVLLSGFDAPTGGQAAQNALPVVMRVKSFMHMPNKFQDNLKECFITGSGYGDLASERVFVRTERLSCILKNNHVIEKKIKGHLVGEDASFGMRGKLVSKQGALLARSFVAGMFSGLGNSVAAQSQMMQSSPLGTVTTIDPARAEQAALGSGISTSTGKIADFYLQQANLIFPVIEVAAMRIGEVFLVEGVNLNEQDANTKTNTKKVDSNSGNDNHAVEVETENGDPS